MYESMNRIGKELTEREREILMQIVRLYILKASPIGSFTLSKYLEGVLNLSPATIRNVMADLEELEYITHPHTSAGRIPTDKGYRFYVDSINDYIQVNETEINKVRENLSSADTSNILRDTSKILGMLSNYLSIVKIPKIVDCKVVKLDIIKLSSNRLLIVLALDSNIVRTISLEVDYEIDDKHLFQINQYINEKISNKTIKFIKENFHNLLSDYPSKNIPLLRLFTESLDDIFTTKNEEQLLVAGTQNLLQYPEFESKERIKSIIELIENQDIVIHLLDEYEEPGNVKVLIGSEMNDSILDEYALVLSSYKLGSSYGSIGLIGPKRMNYPKIISLVKAVSAALSST